MPERFHHVLCPFPERLTNWRSRHRLPNRRLSTPAQGHGPVSRALSSKTKAQHKTLDRCLVQTRSAPASETKTEHEEPTRASFHRGGLPPRTGKPFSLDGRGSYRSLTEKVISCPFFRNLLFPPLLLIFLFQA